MKYGEMRKISNIKGTKITLSLFFKMFKQVYLQLLTTFSNTLLKEDWVKSFKVRNEKLEHQLFSQNNKRENRIEKSSENILKLAVCVLCAGEMNIIFLIMSIQLHLVMIHCKTHIAIDINKRK